jgi:hypothetical protein
MARNWRHCSSFFFALAVGHQAVVADTLKPFRQDVKQKTVGGHTATKAAIDYASRGDISDGNSWHFG